VRAASLPHLPAGRPRSLTTAKPRPTPMGHSAGRWSSRRTATPRRRRPAQPSAPGPWQAV